MKQIIIEGGHELSGEIVISGAKNAAVALIPAALLSDGIVTIDNVPNISDVDALEEILLYLDAEIDRKQENLVRINSKAISNKPIKELLLDQSIITGIGNIYADEILFLSHIKNEDIKLLFM